MKHVILLLNLVETLFAQNQDFDDDEDDYNKPVAGNDGKHHFKLSRLFMMIIYHFKNMEMILANFCFGRLLPIDEGGVF